ncbi:MAG: OmpA family protein [Comamonadaceae bacterium]|nr:MAG: OmpA family protein [Comamonadaceae bacterium]
MTRTVFGAALIAAFMGALAAPPAAFAQDAKGCQDPALFAQRIPNYVIASCKRAQDADTFRWLGGKQEAMGLRTELIYKVPNAADGATPKYITTNYANALKSIGGELLQDPARNSVGDRLTARVRVDGRLVWAHVSGTGRPVGGHWASYKLVVLQEDAAAQVVSAQRMLDALGQSGFIALYIPFDTAKSDIKPEAQSVVGEIAGLLRTQPALKVSIEGHTDNVGTPAANKALSESRARAVMQAVVAQGIAADRMRSTGHGQEKPVADNRSEEGRAKNRRVELVKQP